MKRYCLAIIILISLLVSQVPPARASEPVIETSGALQETAAAAGATAGSTASTFTQKLFEWGQTFVLETLKKRILDMIVDQIIQWVQGGGDPKFVTDWQGFLQNAGQAAVGDLAQELGLGFLCQPLSARLRLAMQRPSSYSQRAACTLDKIVGNIQNFANNFENGGWIAYTESLKPQNNFYGSLIMALEEMETRAGNAQSAAALEGLAGGGFLGVKKKDCREDSVTGPDGFEFSYVDDIDGDGTPGDIPSSCKETTTTPGSIVGSLASQAVGIDIPYILEAQQLQEYLSAIANAMINRLIKEGVNGLSGVGTESAPSSGYVSRPAGTTSSDRCAGLTGSALQSCLQYNQATSDSFTGSRNNILTQIDNTLLPRIAAKNYLTSAIANINSFASSTTAIYENLIDLEKKDDAPAICFKPKNQLLQDIISAIDEENDKLADLQAQLAANQTIIDDLVKAKNDILAVTQDDWESLGTLTSGVQSKLDSATAENLKRSTESTKNQIKTETTRLLNSFNQEVARCYE